MSVPEAVKKMEERAEALYAKTYGKRDTEDPAPDEKETPEEPTEEELEVEDTDYEEPSEADLLREELTRARNAFDTLQGKYDAEIPRYAEELRELKRMIADKEEVGGKADISQHLPTLKETFGEEMANELDAYLDARIGTRVDSIEGKLEAVTTATTSTAKGVFFDTLDTMVPDWRKIKDMPEFRKFLNVQEPFSGKTRHDLAVEAQESLDAGRVASFYKSFIEENPSMKNRNKKPKSKLVAPEGSNKAGVGSEPETEYVRSEEIKRFYDDVRKGVFRGREDEMNKIEAQINKAIAEGRVVK